jgi:hypothetical protein
VTLRNHKKRRHTEVAAPPVRRDLCVLPIQDHVQLEVYWKVLAIGKGPAVIFRAHGREIMKFDCFGEGKGHYHVAPKWGVRIYFEETSASEQIARAAHELRCNAQRCLILQSDERIRKTTLNNKSLAMAIEQARSRMAYFLNEISALHDI